MGSQATGPSGADLMDHTRPPLRVLIVDDEPDIRETLQEAMGIALDGAEVAVAPDGRAALEMLERTGFDLIITDYRMPGMDGIRFLKEARARHHMAPAILMTAYPDLELAMQAINDGRVEHFLTKPLRMQTVMETTTRVLTAWKAQTLRAQAFANSLDAIRRALVEETARNDALVAKVAALEGREADIDDEKA